LSVKIYEKVPIKKNYTRSYLLETLLEIKYVWVSVLQYTFHEGRDINGGTTEALA
jgi:hypothetical protein